jgi:phage terminase large subunit
MEINFPKKLRFLIDSPARYKVLFGGRGGMKCLAVGTKVIMFDGSLRNIENIWSGEYVMGPDSKPRKVTNTTRGIDMMYKVNQTSGIDYICNSAHIVSLKKSESAINDIGEISKQGNARRPNGRYPSYSKITNINVVEVLNQSKRWLSHFRGYKAGLIHFKEKFISIDPWFLGMWLGDGKSNDTIIYSADDEVLQECKKYALLLGLEISVYIQPNNKSFAINLRKVHGDGYITNVLNQYFKNYNLFDNKHIPIDFIANSEQIRLEILAGLIDSDGTIHSNGYDIYQTNERLAKDIKYLADTLGFRTNFSCNKTVCGNNGVIGKAFRVSINGDTWRIPCRVKHKIIKRENVKKNKDFLLSQIKIECVGEGEYAGFSLDGDGLFLLEDGTVTHNTETIAMALIILATQKKLRIACFRELQSSIEESVYETIKNRIIDMELEDEFDIQARTIISRRTGAEFIFSGLRYNINKIKSMARIDIAWVEEAINVSKTSWDKLSPTIRGRHESDPNGMGGPFKEGPEIWVSFNPELDTDETYKRFVLKRDSYAPDYDKHGKRFAYVVKVGWEDNPWFPNDLRREMEILKDANENDWLNVWQGHTKQTLDGAIYAEEIKKVLLEGRRGKVLYDSTRPVHTFWDLGHWDSTAIWFIQRIGMEYNIINYFQDRLKKVPYYLEHLQSLGYVYGIHHLPHDGDNETLASRSVAKIVRDTYPKGVRIVPRVPKKDQGIKAARMVFDLCNFDEENTSEGWQCLCRYQYEVNENGSFSKTPKHDEYSNGADGFQTFALSLKSEIDSKKPKKNKEPVVVPFRGQTGWMT